MIFLIYFIYYAVFLFISFTILLKSIGYGIYEINEEKNKYGGITIILLSIVVVIFSNIMLWIS